MRYQHVNIESVAHVLPPHVITSEALEDRIGGTLRRLGFPRGTVEKLTGVRERRWFDLGVTCSQASALAAERALSQAGLTGRDIQVLVNGSVVLLAGSFAVGTVIGAILATIVFAISAISIPMLLDRDVGVATAIAASVAVVRANLRPMALWAALIVVFTALGLATLYIGLAVALPLIGLATWHAYRDMVE
jgi:hypothetical protein